MSRNSFKISKQFCTASLVLLFLFFLLGIASPDTSPTCKTVLDAVAKVQSTPHHIYQTAAGQPVRESIFADGVLYIQVKGKWQKSPMTMKEMQEQEAENIKNAKAYTCCYVKDETVGSEAAALYNFHQVIDENTKSDGQMWISKRRGLILKEEDDPDSGEKRHLSIRYDYDNVHALSR
jgi:hypothetical protein